jgi:hypothetical protein
LPGDSDREGFQRLYLTRHLDYHAEFPINAMLQTELVPADQFPFPGIEATRVFIAQDAIIQYTWVGSPQPVNPFDLDIRVGATSSPTALSLGRNTPVVARIAQEWSVFGCDRDVLLAQQWSRFKCDVDFLWVAVPRQ